jgi:hypothetical protein
MTDAQGPPPDAAFLGADPGRDRVDGGWRPPRYACIELGEALMLLDRETREPPQGAMAT